MFARLHATMRKAIDRCTFGITLLLLCGIAQAITFSAAKSVGAVEAILETFESHAVVGIGEVHSLQELGEFYIELIRQPLFAQDVGIVVIEFGNAFYQPLADRYFRGAGVTHQEISKAWTTTIGFGKGKMSKMYGQFYKAVREVNKTLPKNQKIKVWLGDPPADPSDPLAYSDAKFPDRDGFFADIVINEVLMKRKKALLIIGAGHLETKTGWRACVSCSPNVRGLIEATDSEALFVVQPHFGLPREVCNHDVEEHFPQGSEPALTSLRTTELKALLNRPACRVDNDWSRLARAWGDAYLYLGKSAELTLSPYPGEPATPYLKLLRSYFDD